MHQPGEPTADDRIIELLRSSSSEGKHAGLRLLLEKHGQRARSWLTQKYGRNRSDQAQDAIHDAVLSVLKNIDQYDRERGPLDAWFFAIARNAFVARLRAEQMRPLLSFISDEYLESMAARNANPSHPSDWLERALAKLEECIDILSPMQRDVILADLGRGGEADEEELARRWQTSIGTIRNARQRARARLRKLMRKLRR